MNQVIAPKARYLKSKESVGWAEAVTGSVVKTTFDAALLQFIFEQETQCQTFDQSARNALRLEGARRILCILLNLAEKEVEKPIKMASDNLSE